MQAPIWFQQGVENLRHEFNQKLNGLAGATRKMQDAHAERMDQQLKNLAAIASVLKESRSWYERTAQGIVRIEDLPGVRVPYDLTVDIPIGADETAIQESSAMISQDGPFVAVARYATFQSTFEFTTTESGTTTRFNGRSFGRYRPIHSAWDVNDAQSGGTISLALPLPASLSVVGYPELTSSMSGFRTMEFDGRVLFEDAGSGRPRQNQSVPTSFWTKQINSPQDLGALDFFERGSVLTWKVTPNHINNPPAGNAEGNDMFGTNGWPFIEGQFDKHEGIVTPGAFSTNAASPPVTTRLATDIVERLPNGILTIGFLGYRIIQPVGPIS